MKETGPFTLTETLAAIMAMREARAFGPYLDNDAYECTAAFRRMFPYWKCVVGWEDVGDWLSRLDDGHEVPR